MAGMVAERCPPSAGDARPETDPRAGRQKPRSGAWRRVRRRFEDGCRDGGRRYVATTGYSVVIDGRFAVA
jgi:hypothetical protein